MVHHTFSKSACPLRPCSVKTHRGVIFSVWYVSVRPTSKTSNGVHVLFCCRRSAEEVPDDVDMEENKDSDDSDEENDVTEKAQETHNTDLTDDVIHQLSKYEEKELRKFRKVDYSWLAAL